MKELSLNVLDIVQNSISAAATLIEIEITEDTEKDLLLISIADNGKGMTDEQIKQISDPFYTTRTTRKIGLGIPLFRMAAEMAGGSLNIKSALGSGTVCTARFVLSHIDRMPIGDMEGTVSSLIYMNPMLDFIYTRKKDQNKFTLDTREIKTILCEVPINDSSVTQWIADYLKQQLDTLG